MSHPGCPAIQIIDLDRDDAVIVRRTAEVLVAGFRGVSPAWPDLDAALEEVLESCGVDRISRVAVDAERTVLGWIGRSLAADLEECVRDRGGLTLWLGGDDDYDATTLSGVDLYPDVFEHVARIRNLRNHPYAFYQRVGFTIVGVLPDANGWGKPDIYMAKRVERR